jgi:hypothetical protein
MGDGWKMLLTPSIPWKSVPSVGIHFPFKGDSASSPPISKYWVRPASVFVVELANIFNQGRYSFQNGLQTFRNPTPSKSFTLTVAKSVTPWAIMVSALRVS